MRGRRSKLKASEIAALRDWYAGRDVEKKAASLGISVPTLYRLVCDSQVIKKPLPEMYFKSQAIENVNRRTFEAQ